MIVDVHCHVGFSARPVDPTLPRFSFEPHGAAGRPGCDSYFSPRFMVRLGWLCRWEFVRRRLGCDWRLGPGPELDAQIQLFNERHMLGAAGVDRLMLLAFDEAYTHAGRPLGPRTTARRGGSDLYVSNTLVRAMCAARPNKFLFGASLHPYRRGALDALAEVKAAGAVLVKWLPVHHNIDAADARGEAFLARAAELRLAMLIHYGGEMTLARNVPRQEDPTPLLATLRRLRRAGRMPTTIVAHVATPTTVLHSHAPHRALVDALLGEFADAPLYADVSALAAAGRAPWLTRLARRRALHRKLVWGSDFPVPIIPQFFWPNLGNRLRAISSIDSWIEQDLALKRTVGLPESVFHRAGEILHGVAVAT